MAGSAAPSVQRLLDLVEATITAAAEPPPVTPPPTPAPGLAVADNPAAPGPASHG